MELDTVSRGLAKGIRKKRRHVWELIELHYKIINGINVPEYAWRTTILSPTNPRPDLPNVRSGEGYVGDLLESYHPCRIPELQITSGGMERFELVECQSPVCVICKAIA